MKLVLTLLFSSLVGQAYIPNSQFIFLKLVKNHGSGDYRIEQEVTFPFGNDQKVIKETWYSRNGQDFYLLAKGRGFHLERLYINGKAYAKSSNGQIVQLPWPKEFVEPWFLTTSTRDLTSLIRKADIANTSAFNWDPVKSLEKAESPDDLPVRLTRNRGVVMYSYGTPTPKDTEDLNPTLWVEQDRFVVRRIRYKSKTEIIADEFSEYAKNLSFPKTRMVNWSELSVPLRVVQITALGNGSSRTTNLLSYNSFVKNKENKTVVEENLVNNSIEDFYSRFR